MVRSFGEKLSFYNALQEENKRLQSGWNDFWGFVKLSKYSEMLASYIKQFGKENVHVILFEDFKKNTNNEMSKVFEFLDLKDYNIVAKESYNNTSDVRRPFVRIVAKVIKPFSSLSQLFLGKKIAQSSRKSLLKMVGVLSTENKLNSKEIEYLLTQLRTDIIMVEKLMGRETGWLQKYDVK